MAGSYLGTPTGGLPNMGGSGLPHLPTEILMDEYMFGRRRQVGTETEIDFFRVHFN